MRGRSGKKQPDKRRFGFQKRGVRRDMSESMVSKDRIMETFENLMESGTWEWDMATDTSSFSKNAMKLFGFTPFDDDGTLHQQIFERLDAHNQKLVMEAYAGVLKQGTTQKIMVKMETPDHQVRRLFVSMFKGKLTQIHGVVQDISEWTEKTREIAEQLKFTEEIFDAVPDPIFFKDLDDRYIHCNEAMLKFLGLRRSELIGRTMEEVFREDLASAYHVVDSALLASGEIIQAETTMRHHDGTDHHIFSSKTLIHNLDGSPKGIVGTFRDINKEKENKATLERMSELQQSMIWITHSAMENIDPVLLYNHILGMGLEAVQGADHGSVLIKDEDGKFRAAAWRGYVDEEIKTFELDLEDSFLWHETEGKMDQTIMINDLQEKLRPTMPDLVDSHEGFALKASLCAPLQVGGEIYGLLNLDSSQVNSFDETDLMMAEYMREHLQMALSKRHLYDRVVYLSRHDSLTGVFNRAHFEELAGRMLKSATRYGRTLTLALFDMNDLKRVNDTLGHANGDVLIKEFARAMQASIRDTDIFGRYGGDEFVVIMEEADPDQLKQRFNQMLDTFKASPILLEEKPYPISFSYGIAQWPIDAQNFKNLTKVADERMYAHKTLMKKQKSPKGNQ